jgi:hypothetical protein
VPNVTDSSGALMRDRSSVLPYVISNKFAVDKVHDLLSVIELG